MKKQRRIPIYFALILLFAFAGKLISSSAIVQAENLAPKASITKKTLYVGYRSYPITMMNMEPGAKLSFTSENKAIATVTKEGVITPVSKGTVKITAKVIQEGKTYQSYITVTVKNPYVTFAEKRTELQLGMIWEYQGKPYGLEKTEFAYYSSNPEVATINESAGLLNTVSIGTTDITVKDLISGKSATIKLTVTESEEALAQQEEADEDPVARLSYDGEYVYFGSYPQTEIKGDKLNKKIIDAKYSKGKTATVDGTEYMRITYEDVNNFELKPWKGYKYFKVEPIKWRILKSSDTELFVVAEKALDNMAYCFNRNKNRTWEGSDVRSWLNADNWANHKEAFLTLAFTKAEQKAILQKTVKNSDNSSYKTDGGNDTKDKVFLLSLEEITNKAYGFSSDTSTRDTKRITYLTDYAEAIGAYNDGKDATWWMLRTPGATKELISIVYGGGRVEMKEIRIGDLGLGIRPAIRIDLKAVTVSK